MQAGAAGSQYASHGKKQAGAVGSADKQDELSAFFVVLDGDLGWIGKCFT